VVSLKGVSTGKTEHAAIDNIVVDNVLTTDKREISNGFNNFFSTVGVNISESVQNVQNTPESYIPDVNAPELDLGITTPDQIVGIIKSFDSKQSCDIDGISLKLLKFIAYEISLPLSHIFNLSLNSGVFPKKLKCSRIVSIFKSGDHTQCDNYR
jgi:hypothetical protein